MKKFLCLLLIFLLVPQITMAQSMKEAAITVKINDSEVNFPDVKPFYDQTSGRVFVPVRFIAEALGASVSWNEILGMVIVSKGDLDVRFKLSYTGNDILLSINNVHKEDKMPNPAFIKDGRVVVPLRFFAEFIGCTVEWDDLTKTANISGIDINKIIRSEYQNPAMPDGLYSIAGDDVNFNVIEADYGVENYGDKLDAYKQDCISRVERTLKFINNVNYETVNLSDNDRLNYERMERINIDQLEKWYSDVKKYRIVKEIKIVTDTSKVQVKSMGQFTIKGKLLFTFKAPSDIQYLSQFNKNLELDKWYSTDFQIDYGYANMAGVSFSRMLLGKNIEAVNAG